MRCTGDSLPRPCAEKFEEMSRVLGKVDRMAEDVKVLRSAVVGNGNAKDSLAFRVRSLEESNSVVRGNRRRWGERLWRVAVAVSLVLFGWWIKD